ncbi:MAG: hypothetical protein V4683_09755, partial [Bacteroidota bacterium]
MAIKPKPQLKLILILLIGYSSFSQKRIGIYNVNTISSKSRSFWNPDTQNSEILGAVPAYCVDFFSNNQDFITIDRKNLNLIDHEREIQKSENFMDGYVVGQGKSEGVDFICQSVYDIDTYVLIIKILDVKGEKILCSSEKKLNSNLFGIKDLKQQVTAMLLEISANCFETEILVLRALETKGKKAKTVLISAGTDLRVKKGYKFEIFELVQEKIGSKVVNRKNTIGYGEVLKVEDENFSVVDITDG